MRLARTISLAIVGAALCCVDPAVAKSNDQTPMPLSKLKDVKASAAPSSDISEKIRGRAVEEAAKSYGARGGLAFRTWQIGEQLKSYRHDLDTVFDFKRLLISAPSGLWIQPPVIVEGRDGFELADGGLAAGVTDLAYRIIEPARIVPVARSWSGYLERSWPEVSPPPNELFPQTSEERERWDRWLSEGWRVGLQQADDIFDDDLNRLVRDYTGMVKYRILLEQGMISKPFANEEDRGVTGGGDVLRIGDRAVRITGKAQLVPRSDLWLPKAQ